jgi:ribosomal protein S18 acetylase RimI-like enzyme
MIDTVRAMDSGVRVDEVTEPFDGLTNAVHRLVRQLSTSARPPSEAEIDEIIRSPASHMLAARDAEGKLIGMLTLVVFRIPTGVRAWIEDVVVDEAARGQGVGAELNRAAIRLARELGARTVDLTSRPSREAANRLYRRLGFVERDSNVYRFENPTG